MSELTPTESEKPTRREKAQIKNRMRGFLMFLPNMLALLGKLLKDGRVPTTEKVLLAGAIFYVLMPLDFIPDIIPFVGQIDDVYLVVLTLLRLINKTDEAVVREHWAGGGDVVSLAASIAKFAPALLPVRVARVLSSDVDLGDAGKSIGSLIKNRRANKRENPDDK